MENGKSPVEGGVDVEVGVAVHKIRIVIRIIRTQAEMGRDVGPKGRSGKAAIRSYC